MTQEEAIKELEFAKLTDDYMLHEALDIAIEALEREEIVIKKIPKGYHYDCETRDFLVYRNIYTGDEIHIEKPTPLYRLEQDLIAQERYEDLCEYFGDAKDILNSRKDFKAWLERIKWHIHKAEELYEINKSLIEIWKERNCPSKETVREWRKLHPSGRKIQCHRDTQLSRPTIDRYWDLVLQEE